MATEQVLPQASASPKSGIIAQTLQQTGVTGLVLGAAVDTPVIAGLLNTLGIDVRGIDEMFVRLSDTKKLDSDIASIKKDDKFSALYTELESKAKESLNKGEFNELLTALKGKKLSDGTTLNEKAIQGNLAKTIAYVSVSEIKKEIPSKWSLFGDSFSDIWDKSFANMKNKSFSDKPLEWLGDAVAGVVNLIKGIIYEPGIQSNAEGIAKAKASTKREEIALRVGGELASRGIAGSVSNVVMAEMYDKLGQQGGLPRMSEDEKKKIAASLSEKLPKTQRENLVAGVAELREDHAATAAKRTITEEEKNRPWYKRYTIDKIFSKGVYKPGEGMKGDLYAADLTKYGIGFADNVRMVGAISMSLTLEGEAEKLNNVMKEINPNLIMTFHDENGKPFKPGKDTMPETVIIGLAAKKEDKPDFYYLRTPGLSVTNVEMFALDVARAGLATVIPGAAVAGAARILPAAKPLAAAVSNSTMIKGALNLGGGTLSLAEMDRLSVKISGGTVTDLELGEAFLQTLAGSAGGKVISKIPTEKVGEMIRGSMKGKKIANVAQDGTMHIPDKDGKTMIVDSAATKSLVTAIQGFLTQFPKKHPILTGGAGIYASHEVIAGESPPPPPSTPHVAAHSAASPAAGPN